MLEAAGLVEDAPPERWVRGDVNERYLDVWDRLRSAPHKSFPEGRAGHIDDRLREEVASFGYSLDDPRAPPARSFECELDIGGEDMLV